MKRILLSITGTVAGLVALLTFKTHGSVGLASGLPSAALPQAGSSSSAPAAPSSSAAAGPPATTSSSAAKSSANSSTTSSAAATRTVVGSAEQTQYGVVQVKVTVSGTKITDVAFVQLTAYDGRSQMINQAAAPVLLQQTLAAQSAQIDGVSGATYTSAGYEASLQSALDQL